MMIALKHAIAKVVGHSTKRQRMRFRYILWALNGKGGPGSGPQGGGASSGEMTAINGYAQDMVNGEASAGDLEALSNSVQDMNSQQLREVAQMMGVSEEQANNSTRDELEIAMRGEIFDALDAMGATPGGVDPGPGGTWGE